MSSLNFIILEDVELLNGKMVFLLFPLPRKLYFNPWPLLMLVGRSVGWFDYKQNYKETSEWISTKLGGRM